MKTKKEFGAMLRVARKKLQLSQNDVARHLGVSVARYANWDRGAKVPTDDRYRLLLRDILGLSWEDMLVGTTVDTKADLKATVKGT